MNFKIIFVAFFVTIFSFVNSFSSPWVKINITASETIKFAGTATICPGGGIKKLEIVTPKAGDTYRWFKDSNFISGETGISYDVTAIGVYYVEVKSGTATATKSNEVKLTLSVLPAANFTHTAGGDCINKPINFTSTSTGAVSFLWDFGDPNSGTNNTSTSANPSHTFIGTAGNGNQPFTVKLTVTNIDGCSSTTNSKTISTKQIPDATINDFSSDKAFTKCQSAGWDTDFTLTITNSSTTKTTNTLYEINWGDGSAIFTASNFDKLTHTYTEKKSYNLIVKINGNNGCQTTKNYSVFNGSNPAVPYPNPGSTQGCSPYTLALPIVKTVVNTPGTTYKVFFSDGSDTLYYSSPPDTIKHTFLKSSCGEPTTVGGFNNAFYVKIVAENQCSPSSITIEPIYVSTKPKAQFTNSADKICINNTLSLNNNSIAGAVASNNSCNNTTLSNWVISPATGWTIISGKLGIINPTNDPNDWGSTSLNVKFTTVGEYTIKLITSNNCGKSILEKTICVNPAPTADFTLDKTTGCGPLTVKATNTSSTPICGQNKYSWSVTQANNLNCGSGSPTDFTYLNGTSASSANPEFQFNSAGVYSVRLTTESADGTGCTVTTPIKTITVTSKPEATITLPISICVKNDVNFTSNVKNCYATTAETYIWTFTGATNPSSTIANPININYPNAGTFNVKLEVTNQCGTTTVNTQVVVSPIPVMQPIADKLLCSGEASGLISFSNVGNVTGVTYSWSRSNEAIGSLPLSNLGNSIASFTTTNTGNTVLTSTFTVTPTLNGCAGSPINFKISVNPSSPTATASTDQILCNQTQTALAGNNSGTFIGTWTKTNGPAVTFDNPNKFDAKVSGLTPDQSYTFRWTIAGLNSCLATFDEVTIFNRPAVTVANAGADKTICDYTENPLTNNSYVLQGNLNNTRSYETGSWSVVSSPPGNNSTFSDANNKNATIGNLIPGIYQLAWTITNDANCTSSTDAVTITVFSKPTLGKITKPTEVCKGENVTLTHTGGFGEILEWLYSVEINGPWISIPDSKKPSITDNNITTTKYYRVKMGSESLTCTETIFINVGLVLVNLPAVGGITTGAQTFCSTTNTGAVTVSGIVGSVVRWESSTDNTNFTPIANSANDTYTFTNVSATTYFRAVVKSGTCTEAKSTSVKITLGETVVTANAGPNQFLCDFKGKITLAANTGINSKTKWKQISGPIISFDNDTLANTAVNIAQIGTYVFEWEISNNVCAPSKSRVTIFNYPPLVNQITGVATYCFGQQASITSSVPTGGDGTYTYGWEKSVDNNVWQTISNETAESLSFTAESTIYIRRTVKSSECLNNSTPVLITVLPAVANNSISSNQDICVGKPIQILDGTTPTGGNNTYTYSWGKSTDNITWTDIIGAASKNYQPINLTSNTYFRRTVTSGLCTDAQKSISNVINITIRPNAIADFTASASISCIPFDLSTVITATAHADVNLSYQWFANGVAIGNTSSFPGYTITTDGEIVKIKLVTTSKFGCDGDTKEIEFSTIKNVIASFTKNKQKDCGPLNVIFSNTSAPLNGASYMWDFGNGESSNLANPPAITFATHPLSTDTTYIIKLKAITACGETSFIDSVTVRSKPLAIFSPNVTVGCSPLDIKFTNQSRGLPNTYTYDFGDGTQLTKIDNSIVNCKVSQRC